MAERRSMMRPAPNAVPWGLTAVAAAFLISVIGGGLAQNIAVGAGAREKSIAATSAGFVGEWVGLVGVPVALSLRRGTRSLAKDFGFRIAGLRDVLIGVGIGLSSALIVDVAYSELLHVLESLLGRKWPVGSSARQLASEGRGPGFALFAVLVIVLAPIAEELFFRGFFMRALQRWIGIGWGVVGAGVVFGLAHAAGTEAPAIPALVLFGVVLGAVYQRTGRLGPGIVAHMTFNAVTVVTLALQR